MFRKGLNLLNNLGYRYYRRLSLIVADIVIWVRYIVGLSKSYLQTNFRVNISIQSQDMAQKVGLVYLLQSVSHLESDLDQNLISSLPYMWDFPCKRKL